MEPVIRNYRSVYQPGGAAVRLISLDDNPTTCTMTYSVIEPGKTSAHHIHPWEHEVYPYNDICLDMLIFPAYVASKGSDYHQEAADVTGTSNRRRGVLHPAV